MADWSKLPYELLGEIVMRLETIEDLVYLSVVCRLWNQFVSTVKHEFYVKMAPWLLLVEITEDNPDCLRNVFNPCNKKCYQLKLPEISGCRCWGSDCGWIVSYNRNFELHIFNPLTKLRLPLPPRSSLPYKYLDPISTNEGFEEGGDVGSDDGSDEGGEFPCFIRKAFVHEIAPSEFIVFVTYFLSGIKLAYSRPGDEAWTTIEGPRRVMDESGFAEDVVVHGATILILYVNASVGYVNISDLNNPQLFTANDYLPLTTMTLSDQQNNLGLKATEFVPAHPGLILDGLYLVKSRNGIFMVVREMDEKDDVDDIDYLTIGVFVCQLQFETKVWSQVHNLGDFAFFVGNNSSMSICVSGVRSSNCRSNCIYLTDDSSNMWSFPHLGGNDMGVFRLENSRIDKIYDGCDKSSKHQPPLWFMPKF